MRKTLTILASAMACVSLAFAESECIDVTMGASATATNTSAVIVGFVEEVVVTCTDGVSTGSVGITIIPPDSTAAAWDLCTNSVVAQKLWRPRVDSHNAAGTVLTTNGIEKVYLYGDTVRVIVSSSPTNKTWRARFKLSGN